MTRQERTLILRHVGSSVVTQALISASSFLVSFFLIRRQTDVQFGFFVLASVTLLLVASLQNSFFLPAIIARLERLDSDSRADLVGALLHDRNLLVGALNVAVGVATGVAWLAGWIGDDVALVLATGVLAALATMRREFLRGVLFAYHRAGDVLLADLIYVLVLLPGAFLATFSRQSTALILIVICAASLCSGLLLSRFLARQHSRKTFPFGIRLREIASEGAWAVFGAAMHWSFSQGYTYLVASLVDLRSVAALAATRLLLMPVNLLSTGISQAMTPVSARWMARWGAGVVFRRLLLQCAALTGVILVYSGLVWLLRDFIFGSLFHKDFPNRDQLLGLWCAVFLVMAIRDQLTQLLIIRARQRALAKYTFLSAMVAIVSIVLTVPIFGPAGAPLGVLIGEALNALSLLVLGWREVLLDRRNPGSP